MAVFFALLAFTAVITLIVGLIVPNKVLRWGEKETKTRKKVLKVYGIATVALFVLVGITAEEPKEDRIIEATNNNQQNETEQVAGETSQNQNDQTSTENLSQAYSVIKVIDGDTLNVDINGKQEVIRIIGINTPETVDPRSPVECFGIEASNRAKELLEGTRVRLEADPTQDERDKYDRLLSYVFLEDGRDYGQVMISEGFAYEYTYQTPYKYQAEYKQVQQEAQNQKRGLWADSACTNTNADTTQHSQTNPPVSNPNPAPTPSPNTTPQTTPQQPPASQTNHTCSADIYNCKDFKTHTEAQAVHDFCMAQVGYDVHGLDGSDNDGLACESLP